MKVTDRNGFSMIEVMVAATIMIVVVMMLGALFQQTSTAWRIGLMRTGGYAQLRSYIGTLQRDANAIINSNQLPKNLLVTPSTEQSFESGRISFYTLTGSDNTRALNYITYDLSGKRIQRTLDLVQGNASGNADWTGEEVADLLKFLPNQTDDNMLVRPMGFVFEFPSTSEYNLEKQLVTGSKRFPLYLSVEAKIEQSGSLYDAGAESAGPDKTWGTKDDIRTFADRP